MTWARPMQVFIGYDPNEAIAYHVLAHSIMRRASRPVSITPLYLPQLRALDIYWRERGETESTEFSLTRFLTPWLADSGISVFMDCDMLCLGDVCELEGYASANPSADVLVVKHDYTPATDRKFLGQKQTVYPKKNWSSLMVFNGHRQIIRNMRPSFVNEAPPSDLHQFTWAAQVGELPKEWNHLVGEYPPNPHAKLVHFTLGGPWFPEYLKCEYAEEWLAECRHALSPIVQLHFPTGGNAAMIQGNKTGESDVNVPRNSGPDLSGLP